MRQLRYLARRRIRRERPLPRWRVFLHRAGSVVLVATLMGSSGWLLGRSSVVGAWAQEATGRVIGVLTAEGFVVAEVFTEGRSRSSRADIVQILEPYEMQSILLVDTVAVRRQLETLPWIRTASVKRAFPNQLRIELQEHGPVARFWDGRRERLLASDGAVIDVDAGSAFVHLPRLTGEGVRARLEEFWALRAAEPDLASRIKGGAWIGERRWNLSLDNGVEVRLPQDQPQQALRRLAQIERDEMILDRAVAAIDMRSPGWVVIEPLEEIPSPGPQERAA